MTRERRPKMMMLAPGISPKLIDRRGNDIFLPVKADEDLFPETRIPETSHDGPEVSGENIIRDYNCSRLA